MEKKVEFWNVDLPDELLELNTPCSSPRNHHKFMDIDFPTFAYEHDAFPDSPDITEIFSNEFLTVEYKEKEPKIVTSNASKLQDQTARNRDEILANVHDLVKVTKSKVQQGPKTTKSSSNTFQVQPIFTIFDQFYGNENSDLFHLPSPTLRKGILTGPQMHQRKPSMVKRLTIADFTPTTLHLNGRAKGSFEDVKLSASKNQNQNTTTNSGTTEDTSGCNILLNEIFDSETQCLHHTHQIQKFLSQNPRTLKEIILKKITLD